MTRKLRDDKTVTVLVARHAQQKRLKYRAPSSGEYARKSASGQAPARSIGSAPMASFMLIAAPWNARIRAPVRSDDRLSILSF